MQDNSVLLSFCLLNTLNRDNKLDNQLDLFLPFFIMAIDDLFEKRTTISKDQYAQLISSKIQEIYQLSIPSQVVTSLFNRAKVKKLIEIEDLEIRRGNLFNSYNNLITHEKIKKDERNIENLFASFKDFYYKESNKKILKNEFEKIIFLFLKKSAIEILPLGDDLSNSDTYSDTNTKEEYFFGKYFKFLSENETDEHKKYLETIFNINLGNILSNILISSSGQDYIGLDKLNICKRQFMPSLEDQCIRRYFFYAANRRNTHASNKQVRILD